MNGDNPCIALFDEGADVTCQAEAAVTGCRFVKISDPAQGPALGGLSSTSEGSNLVVSHCGAGEKAFGVSSYDADAGSKLYAVRGHKIVPVLIGAGGVSAGQKVMSDANGKAVAYDPPALSGNAEDLPDGPHILGIAVDDAAADAKGFIALSL